jgi:serine/threonine protein kinase
LYNFSRKTSSQSFFVGTSRSNNQKVTIKEHHTSHSIESDVTEEIKILSKLSNESIPKLLEIFITNISVFVVTDFVDSMRLKHYVDVRNKTTKLTPADSRKIIKSLISAVSYCHTNDVIIRHLTAENIMVKSNGKDGFEVKICDFSLAVPMGSIKVLCDHPLFEWNAVPYLAPEALLGHPYSTAMDVWSIGVLLFLMVAGRLPFDSADDKDLVEMIKFASYEFTSDNNVWASGNDKIKYLIGLLLVANPTDRPASSELLKNEWLVVG